MNTHQVLCAQVFEQHLFCQLQMWWSETKFDAFLVECKYVHRNTATFLVKTLSLIPPSPSSNKRLL